MPAKGSIKQYTEGGHYHAYNRGVERRRIFLDDQDYHVFLHLLQYYLSPATDYEKHPLLELTGFSPVRTRPLEPLYQKVDLICYCLMPNHFHLLIKQTEKDGMEKLLRRLLTSYVMYFNRRYDRIGHLFQGTYKAMLVEGDEQLLHLSRYIHQNPTLTRGYLDQYPYSSYPYFIGERRGDWLKTEPILSFFRTPKTDKLRELRREFRNYKEFVETSDEEPEKTLGKLVIEKD